MMTAAAGAWAQSTTVVTREGSAWVETTMGTIMAPEAAQLKVETRGNVAVRGDGGPQVSYTVRKRVQARSEAEARALFAACEFRSRRLGPVVYLTMQAPARTLVSPELDIHAPRPMRHVIVDTVSGSLQFFDLGAEVQAMTGGGPVTADRMGSGLSVRTGGGDIRLGTIGGWVRATTAGGPIYLKKSGGEAILETGGGEIVVEESEGGVQASTGAGNVDVTRAAGAVQARTNGGVIHVKEAGGLVTAESAGGAIQISAAKGVKCEAAAGGIRLRGVSGEVRAATNLGSILAELLGGRGMLDSYLTTSNGDITVVIPSNLAVTVEAMNESPGRTGAIISEFSEIRVQPGSPRNRNRVMASGSLNGGGPVLRIAANEGTIFLRRQR